MERYAYSPGERRRAETYPERSGELLPETTFSFSKNKKIYLNSRYNPGMYQTSSKVPAKAQPKSTED